MGNDQLRSNGDNVTEVGTIGVLCGATTLERMVRKTPAGPLHQAVCNRWHGHTGRHWMTDRKFTRLFEWDDVACRAPDWKAAKRAEMAIAARAARDV